MKARAGNVALTGASLMLLLGTVQPFCAQTNDVVTTRANTEDLRSSGGPFTLTQAVIANGGNHLQLGSFSLDGTAGQSIAADQSNGGPFSEIAGFWVPDDLGPTAAGVVVSGRILTADGAGIRNVTVTITLPSGETRQALSSSFGYYRFDGVPAGETCTISVTAKRYRFDQPAVVLSVNGDLTEINFIGIAIER